MKRTKRLSVLCGELEACTLFLREEPEKSGGPSRFLHRTRRFSGRNPSSNIFTISSPPMPAISTRSVDLSIFSSPAHFLLQPMKNADKVRAFLLSKGYGICRDYTFFAEGKFYDVIKACKGAPSAYTEDMILFGGDNLISPRADFLKKLEKEIRLNELWLQEAKEGRENILARLRKLRGIYDETCGRLREN